ncbi:MAG: type I-C CRISPR-associated endonuclease Cas1c [Candidatus Xenobiia bacterium LiM19]
MKHFLNTLYITTQGAYLSREGETVVVRVEHETKFRIPILTLGGIVCFGQVSCSPQLMQLCCENNITVSFLSEYGKFYARVQGPVSGNVLLRREQYRRADDLEFCTQISRSLLVAKLANSRVVLLRACRDYPDDPNVSSLNEAAQNQAQLMGCLQRQASLETMRGWEGDAARTYFNVFDHLIVAQKQDFYFHERNRRPPLDNMNALLSFLYTLLTHDVVSALESVGLDPAVGFLHRDRPGRPGLALDMMEEFRPYLADRLALSLVNRQQLRGKGFIKSESGAVQMDDDTRKELLVAYQKRKTEEITHPFIGEKMSLGLLPYIQAMLLARHLRGDLDGYPPFIWR